MRYNDFTMLPERAFQVIAGRMTLEGGGGGGGGKGGGKGGAPAVQQVAAPAPAAAPPPIEPAKQADKAPDMVADSRARRKQSAMAGGNTPGANNTLLTGPTGVDPGALSLGKNTLLGG